MDFQSRFEGKTAYMNKLGNIADPNNPNNNMVLQKTKSNATESPNLFGQGLDATQNNATAAFAKGQYVDFNKHES